METNPTKQRQAFCRDYVSGQWSMSELCRRCQVFRPSGHKMSGAPSTIGRGDAGVSG